MSIASCKRCGHLKSVHDDVDGCQIVTGCTPDSTRMEACDCEAFVPESPFYDRVVDTIDEMNALQGALPEEMVYVRSRRTIFRRIEEPVSNLDEEEK